MSKKSFVKGAAILAAAGLIAKLMGALFRIPLTNILSSDGIGLYQMAYPIYSFILVVSTAGIPTAISKLVAEKLAINNPREAYKVFRVSFRLMLGIGIGSFLLLLLGSGVAARLVGSERALYSIIAITPSLIFVTVISAFRGYFQGMQYMTPTAVSQIVEQAGKLVLGLYLASVFVKRGVEYGAAAAVAGVTLSEGLAFALLIGIFRRKRKDIRRQIARSPRVRGLESERSILVRLAGIAIPITIGASIMPLINVVDMFVVVNKLTASGFSQEQAESLYGLLTGSANTIINFPAVFTIALAMSLVPAISHSYVNRERRNIAQITTVGIRLTMLFGLPAAVGLAVLAHPVPRLLFSRLPENEIKIVGDLLVILAIGVIFLTLVQTLTSILQGINKVFIPVRNLFIGAIFKIIFTYILVGNPDLNVKGAAIGTVVCYGVAAVLDFAAVIRHTGIRIPLMGFIIKPALSVSVMGVVVWFAYNKTITILGNTKATALAILAGIAVYAFILLLIGAIRKQDFELLPGGNKLASILQRLHLLR